MNMQIGRKIYFDNRTGEVLQDTGEREGDVIETTKEQDFAVYKSLNERISETVGMLQLEYGEYARDFAEGFLERIDPVTKELKFRYSDPNHLGGVTEPQKPLTEQVTELKQAIADLSMTMAAMMG
ncbi:hypothetical protein [Paenibacillus tuaregi]|uniref:hypothetical protein n=1 Tax=Paenibacillus tuaregi TaxID=1816681 RepID=UPI000839315C|nr:hypothetical protein [Paenibacillus tuaregi]